MSDANTVEQPIELSESQLVELFGGHDGDATRTNIPTTDDEDLIATHMVMRVS